MKKFGILSLCLLAGMAVSAQKTVVKEANSAMNGNKDFTEVVKIMTPAFTNAETANDVDVYYVPGKAGFKQYDALFLKKQIGQLSDDDALKMAQALVGGYEYFLKALPLDSIPNEKGKVSLKRSKDIVKTVAGHYSDFSAVAIDFWNAKDYMGAYNAWDIYLNLPSSPVFGKSVTAVHDTVAAEVYYNQALAAWQAEAYDKAVTSFKNAIAKGYTKKEAFSYGMAVANGAKDNESLLEFASKGNDLYGADDSQFISQIVNYYLQTEKYDDAIVYLEKAISENPNNAQYYALSGIIYDNKNEREKAMSSYEKALSIDSENALANFYQGRSYALKAGTLSDEYTGSGFNDFKAKTLDPLYKQSAELLEKAYKLDENLRSDALRLLEIVYYNLNDEAGMESVKTRRLND
jgi:tetratricopeptide (TPR) repeat protein